MVIDMQQQQAQEQRRMQAMIDADVARKNFQNVEQDPEFARLDYSQQQQVRSHFVGQFLPFEQGFGELSAAQQEQVFAGIVSRPPVFANPETGQRVMDLVGRASSGDESAQKAIDEELFADRMRRSSMIFSLVDQHLFGDVFHEDEKRQMQDNYVGDMRDLGDGDTKKAIQYMRTQRNEIDSWSMHAEAIETAAGVVTNIAEFMLLWKVGAGPLKNPKGLGMLFTKGLGQATSRAAVGSFKRFGLNVATSSAHALATTTLGVGREKALEFMNNSWERYPNFRTALAEEAQTFGKYVAFDILTNMFFDIALPHANGIVKSFKGQKQKAILDSLSNFDVDNLGKYMFADTLDETLIKQYPQWLQDTARAQRNAFTTLANVEKAGREELLNLAALRMNMTVVKNKSGTFSLKDSGPSGKSYGQFKDLGELESKLVRQAIELDRVSPTVLTKQEAGAVSAMNDHVLVREQVQRTIKDFDLERADMLANVLAPKGGAYKPKDLQNVVREIMRQSGAEEGAINKVRVTVEKGGEFLKIEMPSISSTRNAAQEVPAQGAKEVLDSPEKLLKAVDDIKNAPVPTSAPATGTSSFIVPRMPSGQGELDAVKKILTRVQKTTRGLGTKSAKARIKSLLGGGYQEQLAAQNLYTPAWTRHAAENMNVAVREENGKVLAQLPGRRTPMVFANEEEFGRWIVRQNMDKDYIKEYLRQYEGAGLTEDAKTGMLRVMKGSRELARANSLDELIASYPALTNHAPKSLGPELVIADLTTRKVQASYTGRVYNDSMQGAMKHLDMFKSPQAGKATVGNAADGKITLDSTTARRTYEVEIPEIAYRGKFDSLAKAREWVNEGWQDGEKLRHAAMEKGYRIETHGGKYLLYTDDGQRYVMDNMAQVAERLKTVPTPEWAPELSGLSEDLIKGFSDGTTSFAGGPQKFADASRWSVEKRGPKFLQSFKDFEQVMGKWYRPPHGWFDSMVAHGGKKEIADLFYEGERVQAFIRGREYVANKSAMEIMTLPGQKRPISAMRQSVLYDYLTMPAQRDEIMKAHSITSAEMKVVENVRKWYNQMGQVFGVPGDIWLENYLPRLRKGLFEMDPQKIAADGDIKSFTELIWGGQPPKELDAFFKHQRVSEIAKFVEEKNILAGMWHYSSKGMREKYLNPWMKQMDELGSAFQKSGTDMSAADKAMWDRLMAYRADSVGMSMSDITNDAQLALENFHKGRGLDSKTAKQYFDSVLGMGYTASMGYRAWLPVRNTFQVYLTLDPWLGGDYVSKAMKSLAKDKAGNVFRRLREAGVITGDLPFTGSDVVRSEEFVGRILNNGMQWYKNSDEFTRAVAYIGSEIKFDEALEQLNKGIINRETFVNLSSGIHAARDGQRGEILKHLDLGNTSTAKHMLGADMVNHTMFEYRSAMRPELFRKGIPGKLFGMFGTYPVQYVENVRLAMTHGGMSAAQKTAWAAKHVANATALFVAFNELLGINAQNFIAYNPMIFSGGPHWNLMHAATQSMNTGYKGRQARAELLGMTTTGFDPTKSELLKFMIPFNFAIRGFAKGAQQLDEGNTYGAFLSFTGAPQRADWW